MVISAAHTLGMYKPLLVGVSLVAMLAACDSTVPAVRPSVTMPPISASPIAASPSPSPSVSPALPVFTVDGGGPYQLGADFTKLNADGKLAEVSTSNELCGPHLNARGVAPWQDIRVSARTSDSKLYLVINRSATIATPSGAKVGMTSAQLKAIYGAAGEELTVNSAKAYLVKTPSGNGLLFDFDVSTKKVLAIIAGNATYLKDSFTNGSDYC